MEQVETTSDARYRIRKSKLRANQGATSFACLNRRILLNPNLLAPFDLAIAAALLMLGRQAFTNYRHKQALAAGAAEIKRRKSKYKPTKSLRKSLQAAGRKGYKEGRETIGSDFPSLLSVRTSRRGLLRTAGLEHTGEYMHKLDAALRTLAQPVGELPPLLHSCECEADTLVMTISTEWTKSPFGQVPMPMPTRSAPGQRLYLLLHTIKTTPRDDGSIGFETLCDRLGIDETWGPSSCPTHA